MKEIWKDIKGYEGMYQISNTGDVKSLERIVLSNIGSGFRTLKEKVLSKSINTGGYFQVTLSKGGVQKTEVIQKLIAIAFLNHKPNGYNIVIDHIDNNPLNNKLSNLQLITTRENSSKDKKGGSSNYVGVHWCNTYNTFISKIHINGKSIYLGQFDCELKASQVYNNKLKQLHETT